MLVSAMIIGNDQQDVRPGWFGGVEEAGVKK
jgi:hypothetical protein